MLYVGFYLAVSLLALVIALVFFCGYVLVYDKKNQDSAEKKGLQPAKVLAIALSAAIIISGVAGVMAFEKQRKNIQTHYASSSRLSVTSLDSKGNPIESDKSVNVFASYFKKDSIPGYSRKTVYTEEDVRWTCFGRDPEVVETNDFEVTPNFIIFVEYLGKTNKEDFRWDNTAAVWKEGNVVMGETDMGAMDSQNLLIAGNYSPTNDEVMISLTSRVVTSRSGDEEQYEWKHYGFSVQIPDYND